MVKVNERAFAELMKEQSLTGAKLARRLGVSRACVSRILRGQRQPGSKFLSSFKTAFPQHSLEYFFTFNVTD